MSRRQRNSDSAPGSDSFLDIVANMVGILIILVMVVGVQAKDAFLAEGSAAASAQQPPPDDDVADNSQLEEQLTRDRRDVLALKSDVETLAANTGEVHQEAQSRLALRNQLQQLTLAAGQLIQDERGKLDDSQRAAFDTRRRLQIARDELEDLSSARIAVENTAAPVVELKHLPTPMAKTVFGREEHFRLSGGRLVYVPLNALAEEMQQHAKLKMYKLKQAPEISEIVGPIGGFTLKYRLVRRKVSLGSGRTEVVREVVDLAGFVLVPSSSTLGEPVDEALAADSQFLRRLSQFDANTTTITIWTYPDSFADFRRVKDKIYNLGYLTAGRPLPAGHPIGGAPHGSRSGAQ